MNSCKIIHLTSENEQNYSVFFDLERDYDKTNLFQQYQQEYFGGCCQNCSIVVAVDDNPALAVLMNIREEVLSFYGQPITIQENLKSTMDEIRFAYNFFNKYIFDFFTEQKIKKVKFAENSEINLSFINNEAQLKNYFEYYIDLNQELPSIKTDIRKSYRSLINWGEKNLNTEIYNHENITAEIWESVREFHIETAGRETRSRKSWELQLQAIQEGRGLVILGYFDKQLVSANLTLFGNDQAYYGIGIYNRQLMAENKPVGHFGLFKSIEETKKLGKKEFLLGRLHSDEVDEKELNIFKFKKGFCRKMRVMPYWQLEFKNEN